jgi:glycine dehydrogenase subunit 1
MCLRSAVYLSLMGRQGLQEVARMSARAARAFAAGLREVGVDVRFASPYFNEFTIDARKRPELFARLQSRGFVLGIPLARWFPDLADHYLCALTELHYPRVADLVREVKACAHDS